VTPIQSSDGAKWLRGLWVKILSHQVSVIMSLLVVVSFLLRVLPLLHSSTPPGDAFVHYKYSIALLDGRLSVPVEAGKTGNMVELYYPPLFHLISLAFFLVFPRVDPYAIMRILATAMAALQMIPVYLIVKRASGSSAGGLLGSYALLATRSDCEMLCWGGYANIAGLLLAASLVYFVMTERLVLSAIFSAAIGLTHHLSTLFMVAVLVPYFAVLLWRKKQISKSLAGVIIGGAVAYATFYRFAWQSIYHYYSNFSPVYNQSLYMTPYILEQVGPLLLLCAVLGAAFLCTRGGRGFFQGKELLLIWVIAPFLLAYAYLFGVQWHGVRWIAFIPQPLAAWTGISLGFFGKKKTAFIMLALLFTIQLFFYIADIF